MNLYIFGFFTWPDYFLKEMTEDPKLWTFFDSLTKEMENVTRRVKTEKFLCRRLLKTQPGRIHKHKSDLVHELQETLHYIFDAVLPFLNVCSFLLADSKTLRTVL